MNSAIALTPQTDPKNFPYVFREFPKVVGYKDDKKTVPITVMSAAEEQAYYETNGSAGSRKKEVDALKRHLAELEASGAEPEPIKRASAPAVAAKAAPAKGKAAIAKGKAAAKAKIVEADDDEELAKKVQNLQNICRQLKISFKPNWSLEQLQAAIEAQGEQE